jgi:hypothetical protein
LIENQQNPQLVRDNHHDGAFEWLKKAAQAHK